MVFDDSHARELLGPAGIRCPHLTDYFPRLIEYAQQTRWGKSPLTREEAASVGAAWNGAGNGKADARPCRALRRRARARGGGSWCSPRPRWTMVVAAKPGSPAAASVHQRRRSLSDARSGRRSAAPIPADASAPPKPARSWAIRRQLRVDRLDLVAGGLQEREVGRARRRCRDPIAAIPRPPTVMPSAALTSSSWPVWAFATWRR